MALITIRPFSGMAPVINPQALPVEMAQNAVNAKLIYGDLRPWRQPEFVITPSKSGTKKTIYRWGENETSELLYWFSWTSDVDVVRAPIADDTTERTYFTGDGVPKVTNSTLALTGGTGYPVSSYNLGVPAPATQIQAVVNAATPGAAEVEVTAADIATLIVGDVIRFEIDDSATPVDITLTAGAGGKVTATSLASQVDAVSGVNAAVSSTSVIIKTDSTGDSAKLVIKKKTGTEEAWDADKVSYTTLVGTVYGVPANGAVAATGATYTLSAATIAGIVPGTKLSIKINDNADVLVTVLAGVGTFPAAVTADSLKNALKGVSGWTVTVNDGVSQTITVTTTATGASSSLRVRTVTPGTNLLFSTVYSVSGGAGEAIPTTVAYVMTYVTNFDEESAPSGPSNAVDVKFGESSVALSNLPTGISGAYSIKSKRIYRSNTGTKGTQYQFLVELPLGQTTYSDTTESADLGEVVPTWGWLPPPNNMAGLRMMANGIGVGFVGTTLYISEPYALYAYPAKYNQSLEFPVVGIGVFGQSAFIGTKGFPYILTGSDPDSVSAVKLEAKQPCVSKRSIVEMLGGVIYASPDGLFMVNGSGISPVTSSIMSRDDWQAYKPESIHAYELDNRYFAFYDTGTTQGCLVFSFGEKPSFSKIDLYATAGYNDKTKDSLYLCINGQIKKFDSAAAVMSFTWRSKKFRTNKAINLGAARVDADAYPVTFKLYADGILRHTQTVFSQNSFRLPSGYKAIFFEVQLEGTTTVNAVFFGETMNDMKA